MKQERQRGRNEMTTTTTKNYYFTFRLSGLDCNKKPVKDTGTFHQTMRASTQALAEKKLRANYYKSVSVDIQSVQVTD
jgi:hypothetical protein